jgi:hypothetical protein
MAGFFSGNGNGALSSLAAAADGGVTAKPIFRQKIQRFRIGRYLKKRQMGPDGNTR